MISPVGVEGDPAPAEGGGVEKGEEGEESCTIPEKYLISSYSINAEHIYMSSRVYCLNSNLKS